MRGHLLAQFRLSRHRISLDGTAAMDKAKYKKTILTSFILTYGSYGNELGKLPGFEFY